MIRIELLGSPAPQGSKRYVGTSATGRGIMVESSKKVRPWRQDVKAAAERVMAGRAPLDGPLVCVMTFTVPKPASAPKRTRTWPCRKPDASKLARSTEDALTDAGVWADDARVVSLVSHKVYPNEGRNALHSPGAVIEVYDVTEVEIMVQALLEQRPVLPVLHAELAHAGEVRASGGRAGAAAGAAVGELVPSAQRGLLAVGAAAHPNTSSATRCGISAGCSVRSTTST